MAGKVLRTIDIVDLVALRRWLDAGSRAVVVAGILVVVGASVQAVEWPYAIVGGGLALATCLAMINGRIGAARVLSLALPVSMFAFMVRVIVAPPIVPPKNPASQTVMLVFAVIAFAVSLVPAIMFRLRRSRNAVHSSYLKIAFSSRRVLAAEYTSGLPAWWARARTIRMLPILAVVVLLAATVGVAFVLQRPAEAKGSQSASKLARTIVLALGGGLFVWAKRRSALRGADMRRIDRRPPVLFLRSFGDDMLRIKKRAYHWGSSELHDRGMTFERMLAEQVTPFGPCIAIGRPGEALAPLGAARDYVSDGVWQDEVHRRMVDATVVMLIVGTSEGLAWELLRLRDAGQLHKLALLFPPTPDVVERWKALLARDRAAAAPLLPGDVRPEKTLALIYADDLMPIAIEGERDEWSYETAVRIAGMLAITTGAEPSAAELRA